MKRTTSLHATFRASVRSSEGGSAISRIEFIRWASEALALQRLGHSRSGEICCRAGAPPAKSGASSRIWIRARKLVVGRFLAARNLDARIVARQMPQHVKRVFRVSVDGTRNFFGRFCGPTGQFCSHLFLKLQ